MLKIGTVAPEFELNDQNDKLIKLNELKGKYVILYFYPRDLTPGCTVEACSLRDANDEIVKHNAVVLGIGSGDEKLKTKFVEKHKLNFSLLKDVDNRVGRLFDAIGEKTLFGKTFVGYKRQTYLIDPEGKICFAWDKVKPNVHADEVLKKVIEMQN